MENLYEEYFQIDPKYYAAVTADLIAQGKVKWKNFYPHETFVKLLETTYRVLTGTANRSIWVEGAYGTGKSHAALTIKSLLDASPDEVKDYFDDYGLSHDLRDKYISLKTDNNILTIHRIGSAGINTDTDLILAVQQSITAALREKGIQNQGEASMKDAFLSWIKDKANHDYFNTLISKEQYAWEFSGHTADDVVEQLCEGSDRQIEETMSKVMKVLKDAGVYGLFTDVNQMADWIRSVIHENHLSAVLFIWDEFSEYFLNHPVGLTGFQTLAEISLSDPFYFMIVAHESNALFADKQTALKTLDRFEKPVKIELPENMAFQLMAQAMKTNPNPQIRAKWINYKSDLNDDLASARAKIEALSKKQNKFGQKTVLSDSELQAIVPIHPYAALVLKNIAVLFNSNQRSMFDFIISDDMTDSKGFKWFINNYGPLDDANLLTVDLLWGFFYGKGQTGLTDDVRGILDTYSMLDGEKLMPDEQRVLKTILLLQAVSMRVTGNELLTPTAQNLDLAFDGTNWNKGKAVSIAAGLIDKQIIFKRPVAGGVEYCATRGVSPSDMGPIRDQVRKEMKTSGLIVDAQLASAIQCPSSVAMRYIVETTGYGTFTSTVKKMRDMNAPERFKVIETFALDENEAAQINQQIKIQINMPNNDLIFIETLSPMGKDLIDQYVENMSFSKYHTGKDNDQAHHFQNLAKRALYSWKEKVEIGAFNVYTPENKTPSRKATLQDLQVSMKALDNQKYYYGVEQYSVNPTLYQKYQLANGAGFGITESVSGAYKASNVKLSIEAALNGAWKISDYWKDPAKQSLPIVHIKKKVDKLVQDGFSSPSGRTSIRLIYEELEKAPFGFMPTGLSAFVLGFVLKEYVTTEYFWSNGLISEAMTVDHMKTAIARAVDPTPKYKDEYIVAMSPEVRYFLQTTQDIFQTPSVGSVESARDQIRLKMKNLSFPIWCVKSILHDSSLTSSIAEVTKVIDDYCGIANAANINKTSEGALAEEIGRIVQKNPNVKDDLRELLTSDQCRKGMLAYIAGYKDGQLLKLALKIDDGGTYLDAVKQKFSAGDANWIWNPSTVDNKISDVILEYEILLESCKTVGKYTTLYDVIGAWNRVTNQIKIPFDALEQCTGDLGPFLQQLYDIKKNGYISEQNKQKFYDLLVAQRENFDEFCKHQLQYFKQVAGVFLDSLESDEIADLFNGLPGGQFTKAKPDYYKFIQAEIERFIQSQWKKKVRDIWSNKTNAKSPEEWSEYYLTPILCMFDDAERASARDMFKVIMSNNPSEQEAKLVIDWLEHADFYDRLRSAEERNKCFQKRIVGDSAILLKDMDVVRKTLKNSVPDCVYDWMDNHAVQTKIKQMAEKEYLLHGTDKAMAVIEKMDAEKLRKYVEKKIQNDVEFGLQILKGE